MNKKNYYWLIILLLGAAFLLPTATSAAFDISKGIVGNLPQACAEQGNCSFCDFVGLFVILQKVILSIFGGLALIMIIWGAQGFIMAAGNQEKITASKKLLTSTLLGVVIILAGYFLVSILFMILTKPTGQAKPSYLALSESWWKDRLGCALPTDAAFCVDKPDNTECILLTGNYQDSGRCQNKKCVSTCSLTINNGACQSASTCGLTAANCKDNPDRCQTGLCDGPADRVCCQP
ncbi:MAG: pilin [Patescibacteria group bacterium]